MTSGRAVQSPPTEVRPDFPQVQTIQGSLGQVVRLPDGQLTQVALAPLVAVGQQQRSAQQQQVMMKRIPNSLNHNLAPHQQVMVNAQGRHFIVEQKQQQNISQVHQQQSDRSQEAQQPQNKHQQQPSAKKIEAFKTSTIQQPQQQPQQP